MMVQKYEKVLKQQKLTAVISFIVGIAIILLFSLKSGVHGMNSAMMQGAGIGAGAGVIGSAIVLFLRYSKIGKDASLKKKKAIEYFDERNLQIRAKTLATTCYISLIALAVVMIAGVYFQSLVFYEWAIWSLVILWFIVYCISAVVYNKQK
jgi:hypothetical protein